MSDAMNLASMGIGNVPNDAPLQRTDPSASMTQEQRDDAMLAEFAEMLENGGENGDAGVGAVEAKSPFTEHGLRNDAVQPAPPDPAVTGGDGTTTQVEGGVAGTTDASSQTQGNQGTGADGLPFELPPTGFEANGDQSATSPGGGQGTGTTAPQQSQSPSFDLNAIAKEMFGDDINEQQARAVFGVAKEMSGIDPVKAAQIQQILNGQPAYNPYGAYQPQYQQPVQTPYPPQPYQPPVQPQAPQSQWQQPVQQPQPQPQFQMPDFSQLPDTLDPDVAATVQPLSQALQVVMAEQQQLRQQQEQLNMQRMAAERQATASQINAAGDTWRAQKQQEQLLTNEEWVALEYEVAHSDLIPMFLQRSGDPVKATNEALNYAYMQKPQFMEREIAKRAHDERLRAVQQAQRTQASTALSGGGAPARVNNPTATQQNGQYMRGKLSPQESMQGLVDGIYEIMQGGSAG